VKDFQKKATQILEQLDKAKTKNIEFVGIRTCLDEMKKWENRNLNAPKFLPIMIGWGSKMIYDNFSNFQQI
jgi:hypothetical protein